ncbi:MAG: hypothetical protein A2Y62_14015 [Candidatus Fischerbacteria bacterium RBG_13_37_8]|uniref:Branched-chain amino acid aminotransferase n=1 Tax=Candidatus Fischerbacteria bacterium RBG_13_37_8 TaxID=1817863 RepID=A0A1F5VFK6_9BACT|nr:MAG: hypothetical protein A2Y62_14015 [Candidatus Fischerbacteria bacterium RBG_13_37_8]
MSTRVNINGTVFLPEEARISVFDRAVLYGDGIYETLRTYDGRLFLYDEHFRRLQSSLAGLEIPFSMNSDELYNEIMKTVEATGHRDTMVRLLITRGISPINLNPCENQSSTLIIIVEKYKPFPQDLYEKGASLVIAQARRNSPKCLSPAIKSLNLLNNFLAYREAIKKKSFDSLLLSIDDYVAEGTTFNVFWVKDGVLYTPDEKVGILKGTTRDIVCLLAEQAGIECNKGFFGKESMLESDECFITSTLKEIMPVAQIDTKKIGYVCPGDITGRLMKLFQEKRDEFMYNPAMKR